MEGGLAQTLETPFATLISRSCNNTQFNKVQLHPSELYKVCKQMKIFLIRIYFNIIMTLSSQETLVSQTSMHQFLVFPKNFASVYY